MVDGKTRGWKRSRVFLCLPAGSCRPAYKFSGRGRGAPLAEDSELIIRTVTTAFVAAIPPSIIPRELVTVHSDYGALASVGASLRGWL